MRYTGSNFQADSIGDSDMDAEIRHMGYDPVGRAFTAESAHRVVMVAISECGVENSTGCGVHEHHTGNELVSLQARHHEPFPGRPPLGTRHAG